MAKENNQENQATKVAVIFADWALDRLREKQLTLEGFVNLTWKTDKERLERAVNYATKNPSYENAMGLTNIATGLMKIYENSKVYTELTERRCEK